MKADQPVQIGILGVGRIAVNAYVPAIRAAAQVELAAAASRDIARARAIQPKRAYGDYQSLLDDPGVEAVYIATHNGLHKPLTLAALERGKHVLCEKPLGCNAAECAEMAAAARRAGLHLVEAFMYRYHPSIREARELIANGAIGQLRTVEASFSFRMERNGDVRWRVDWGGGGVLDVGCYNVNACRYLFDAVPTAVTAMGDFDPHHGVDVALHGVLDFGAGRFGVISCGFDAGRRNRILACGTHGTISLPAGVGISNRTVSLLLETPGETRELAYAPVDTYRLQVEDFARAVRGGEPLLDAEEGYRDAVVIDALLASARQGGARVPVST